ncbi:MAG: hypothetical protein IKF47_04075 [Bacilli bacterium]|nr:hypothetical protein [Bacilli bacterium]
MKKKNKKENDVWIYVLLLTTLLILTESLKTYTFRVMDVDLTFSLFLLPIVYFLIDLIAKKYDYKRAVAAIAVSAVVFTSFSFIMAYFVESNYILRSISGEFCAYVVSAFVNLTIYMFLLNNTETPQILVIFNYVFSLVIYYMFYTLIFLNMIMFDTYWMGYFITLSIQIFICIGLSIVDKKTKRGQ